MKHFSLKELKQLSKWLSEKSQSCAKKYHEVCFSIYIFFIIEKRSSQVWSLFPTYLNWTQEQCETICTIMRFVIIRTHNLEAPRCDRCWQSQQWGLDSIPVGLMMTFRVRYNVHERNGMMVPPPSHQCLQCFCVGVSVWSCHQLLDRIS